MEIIIDTSFIMECVKNKVDFLLTENHGKILLAGEVVSELKNLEKKGKKRDREIAKLALKIIEKNKNRFKTIDLDFHFVDVGIENYVKDNKDVGVATQDKELKSRIRGMARVLTLRNNKKIADA